MSNNLPFFSIVIPTFNCAEFIGQTVDMVRGQSFRDWELVMVDDGSTDQTWEILKELIVVADAVIKIDRRPESRSKGPSACRNIGVENSTGQYIAFLDADDEWSIDRLQNAYNFIQETGAKAIYSGAWVVDRKGNYFRESKPIEAEESLFDFVINGNSFAQTSTLIVKSEFAKQAVFPEKIHFHEDFDFFIEVGGITAWQYFPSNDVVVHWEDNHLKKVNYADCLWFYQKHVFKSRDKMIRIGYLRYMAHELVGKQPSDPNLWEYRKLLEDEGYTLKGTEKLMFRFPELHSILWTHYQKIIQKTRTKSRGRRGSDY